MAIYVTEEEPLYLNSDIRKVLSLKQQTICDFLIKNQSLYKIKEIKVKTKRGNTIYLQKRKDCKLLTKEGLICLLTSTRTPIPQYILDYYNITELNKFQCEEAKWIKNIKEFFHKDTIETQYNINGFRIDAYFSEYNTVIEIDEPAHKYYSPKHEIERCVAINFYLKNPTIVRVNILENNLLDIISKIHYKIIS